MLLRLLRLHKWIELTVYMRKGAYCMNKIFIN